MATDLAEGYRMRLDGIVQRMIANQEPEENIRAVVADFKQKYAVPPAPAAVSPLAAGAEPFKRAATNLLQLPGAVVAGIRAVPQVDWADLLRHPGPVAETAAPMALPAAGAAIGSLIGPAGTTAGLMGGEFANEAIRQLWTGQSQAPLETLTRVASAGVLPAIAPSVQSGVTAAIRGAPRVIPGGSIALQQESVRLAKAAPSLISGEASGPLYDAYAKSGPATIPVPRLQAELGKLGATEARLAKTLQDPKIRGTVNDLGKMIISGEGNLDLETLRQNLSSAGKLSRDLEDTNARAAGAMKDIFKTGWSDIEAAAEQAGPQAGLLKAANKAYRREMAASTLRDWIEGTPTKRGAILQREDGLFQINSGKVLDQIRRDDFWQKSVDPDQLKAITSLFEELGKTPKLPPVRGQQFGTATVIGRTVAGGAMGTYAAGPLGAAVGSYIAANAPRWISSAVMTETGRSLLRRMLRAKDTLSPQEVSLLGAAVGASVQTQSQGPSQ